jgi:hypothetical protein
METAGRGPSIAFRRRWRLLPPSDAERRWDRLALARVLALSFVSLMVLLAGIAALVLRAPASPDLGTASSAGTPPAPATVFVYLTNVTVRYVGAPSGYFGPTTLPYCGSLAPCPAPAGGHLSAPPRSDLVWRIALTDVDTTAAHWVQVVTIEPPLQLEDVYPMTPVAICSTCSPTVFQLTVLTPAAPGSYLLAITITSFD